MHRSPLRPLHRYHHVISLLTGWLFFLACWIWVIKTPEAQGGSATLLTLILSSLVTFPALTFLWIRRNSRLHRDKPPRERVRHPPLRYHNDWKGRTVRAQGRAIRHAPEVVVSVRRDTKYLLVGREAGELHD